MNAELLAAFVTAYQTMTDAYYARRFPTLSSDVISVEMGKRYARIVRESRSGTCRSVACFVDMTTGDILKAASWKAVAKGVRGSALTPESVSAYLGARIQP